MKLIQNKNSNSYGYSQYSIDKYDPFFYFEQSYKFTHTKDILALKSLNSKTHSIASSPKLHAHINITSEPPIY